MINRHMQQITEVHDSTTTLDQFDCRNSTHCVVQGPVNKQPW
jgi:hypothetical protein